MHIIGPSYVKNIHDKDKKWRLLNLFFKMMFGTGDVLVIYCAIHNKLKINVTSSCQPFAIIMHNK